VISIVIPLYNETEIINELFNRTINSLSSFTDDFEVICVDDGSTDHSLEQLIRCHDKDKRFKVISLSRNFGQQPAIFAGLNSVSGEYIGIMDADLQDPPELFEELYLKIMEGYDVAYAVRKTRKENFIKRLAYWLYYRILASLSETNIPLDSGDFSLFTREVLEDIVNIREQNLFIRGIRSWVGYRQTAIEYERDKRMKGVPKYNLKKLMKLAADGLFSFSHVPIKLLGRLGMIIMVFCFCYSVYILYERLFFETAPAGFTTLIIAIFFLTGVQLVSLRILGEYIVRNYEESKGRPLYLIQKRFLD